MTAALDDSAAPAIRVLDVLGWAEGLRLVGRPVGLERRVRWAQASDLLDPSPYLRGGELVLVTGLLLRDARACAQFVTALAATGPAAIGYAVHVVHDCAPDALVSEANRLGIPVFEIPPTAPFILFTERLARERVLYRERRENGYLVELVRTGRARPDALLARAPFLDGADLEVTGLQTGDLSGVDLPEQALVADLGDEVLVLHRGTLRCPASLVHAVSGRGEPQDVPRLIQQALDALALARTRQLPATAADLASLDSLSRCLPAGYLQPFREFLYQPLARYDRLHDADLVVTLEELLHCDGSVTACGRRMFLHANTVRKRLRRIHALTGKNPAVPTDLAALALALPRTEVAGSGQVVGATTRSPAKPVPLPAWPTGAPSTSTRASA
ncbi:PucR family transcriptional regulator [Prauserella cavernicola]|uniref:PucR family transcriptional regulator n=1 Tax=Prauserella cavernicola TaxID=2800127 RepID=A0A934V808_9PSEU|nr:PucR family transcriptional regulator [Prauserella cavernicola]MBK1789162.1 PucR family transcriptional regulator [Prauserella cavernicola]